MKCSTYGTFNNTQPISIEPEWYPRNPRAMNQAGKSWSSCHSLIYSVFPVHSRSALSRLVWLNVWPFPAGSYVVLETTKRRRQPLAFYDLLTVHGQPISRLSLWANGWPTSSQSKLAVMILFHWLKCKAAQLCCRSIGLDTNQFVFYSMPYVSLTSHLRYGAATCFAK